MQKAKTYNIADSNIAGLGTKLEREVKLAAAQHEPQWIGVGREPGLQIWRIEQFIVTPWPQKQYGEFHSGDSYIVLHTYKKKKPVTFGASDQAKDGEDDTTDALAWDIHFWLGESTSVDEAGTAAYKTVELDDILGGAAVQHREVEGHESDRFMGYFDGKIRYLEGGVDSGFKHVEREAHRARLLHIKGHSVDNMMVREVALSATSMNSGDCFVLDADTRLWLWNGSKANAVEKQKGGELARAMRDGRVNVGGPGQKPDLDVVEQGQEDEEFWTVLMGQEAVDKCLGGEFDDDNSGAAGGGGDSDDDLFASDYKRIEEERAAAGKAEDGADGADGESADNRGDVDDANASPAAPPAPKSKWDALQQLVKDAQEGGDDAAVDSGKQLFRLSDGVPVDVEAQLRREEAARKSFSPEADAEQLRTALKKFIGKDTAAIVNVFGKRNRTQLQAIKKAYADKYSRDLLKDLKKKASLFGPEIKKVYQAMLLSPTEFEAYSCRTATRGASFATDDATLVECVCSKTNSDIKILKETYFAMYKRQLITTVKKDTGGVFEKNYGKLLIELLEGKRDATSSAIDPHLVDSDAKVLYSAGEGRFLGTDEGKFRDILAHRSLPHLREVFKAYEKHSKKGRSFEQAVRKNTSGKFRKALLMIVLVASGDQAKLDQYYVERLYRSMKGLGTRDSVLVRELVTVIDQGRLDAVKKLFFESYNDTLSSWIKGDTSGDYRKLLLAMVGTDLPELYGGSSMQFEKVASGKVTRDMLDPNDAFIFDTGAEVFVWIGNGASVRERKHGLHYAQIYLNDSGKPPFTPISRILENGENEVFEASFDPK